MENEEMKEKIAYNYRLFIDSLKTLDNDKLVHIHTFMTGNNIKAINEFKENNYKLVKDSISKQKLQCLNKLEIQKLPTLEGQISLLEANSYSEFMMNMIANRCSTNLTVRKEWNFDLYFAITDHFIELTLPEGV